MGRPPRRDADADGDIERAIAIHFDGDAALHAAFAEACAAQFPIDVASAASACASGDLDRLWRLAHDLRAALLVLGHPAASAQAAQLERCARAGDLANGADAWRDLETLLQAIQAPPRTR